MLLEHPALGHVQVVDLEARLCHAEAKLAQSEAESQAESQAQLVALQLARADQAANQELCQHAELQQAQLLTQLQTCQVGSVYVLCMPAEAVRVLCLFMLPRKGRESRCCCRVWQARAPFVSDMRLPECCMHPAARQAQCTLLCFLWCRAR